MSIGHYVQYTRCIVCDLGMEIRFAYIKSKSQVPYKLINSSLQLVMALGKSYNQTITDLL